MSRIAAGEGTSLAERKRRAGHRLVIGFSGTTVTPELRELAREIRPGGFILFKRNVASPRQVAELNRALLDLNPDASHTPLITVDQEGGRVQRVRAPATVWPSMREVGAVPGASEKVGRALGRELRAMGFNLDYAPVADVDSNPANPVIGDRSFGRDPRTVGEQVTAFSSALQGTGVMACAKHFPGHGDTDTDSHYDLPVVDRPEAALRATELPPFHAAIRAGVGSIMSAHVVYPAWDRDWPATLSPTILKGILRDELRYEGILFTDDLEMKAVSDRYDTPTKVRRTFQATVDVALACHQPELQLELFAEMVRQQEADRDIERLAVQSHERLIRAKALVFQGAPPAPDLSVVGSQEHVDLAERIRDQARSRAIG